MDLKQLTYFVTTIQEGTISKAAKKLHISQPSLSTKLKELELELSTILFERGARSITPTESGKLFYNRATTILDQISLAQKELTDHEQGICGTLHMGVVSSVGNTLLTQWLTDFHALYPTVTFHLVEGNTYEQLAYLREHLIELAIVRSPFSAPDLAITPLLTEPLYAVGHPRFFADTTTPTLPLEALHQQPLILYRRWHTIIGDIYDTAKLSPSIVCLNDDARTTASLAKSGLGIGVIPKSALPLVASDEVMHKELTNSELHSTICLVRHPSHYTSASAKLFASFLSDTIPTTKGIPSTER